MNPLTKRARDEAMAREIRAARMNGDYGHEITEAHQDGIFFGFILGAISTLAGLAILNGLLSWIG